MFKSIGNAEYRELIIIPGCLLHNVFTHSNSVQVSRINNSQTF